MERQIKTLSALNTIYRGRVSDASGRQFSVHPQRMETPASVKKFIIHDKLTTVDRVTLFASEFIATGILVFIGCLGCVTRIAGGSIPHEQISWTFGLAVMIAIQCFGHISGAHINPIVTVAAAVLGNLPLLHVPLYILGQVAGAIAGYGLVKIATPDVYLGETEVFSNITNYEKPLGVCSPGLKDGLSPINGLLVEFTISFILVLVCCGVWDKRNSDKHDSAPIRFGFAIAALAMAGGPYTGANMNPARSFGPALLNGDWKNHWIYWVGPISAALVGGALYRIVFSRSAAPQREEVLAEGTPLNDKI